MGQAPVLLLHHVGRKSGHERVTPVLFMADGERLIVVGSKGGASRHPGWYINLMAAPVTRVEVGRRSVRVRARELEGAERDAYWPRLLKMYPSFAIYQRRTERLLPVVALDPLSDP
jgi:deazaflavin-dependent oxidoreductase (nitroreductase family)